MKANKSSFFVPALASIAETSILSLCLRFKSASRSLATRSIVPMLARPEPAESKMNDAYEAGALRASTLDLLYQWFHRLIAVYSLLFGVLYWVRLIGFYPGSEWRFDLMPVHWQVASVTLAVLFPFAASGLWMLASWGPVIWFICAAIEVTMYVGFPDLYGSRTLVVMSHLLVAVIYVAFRVLFILRRRREAD